MKKTIKKLIINNRESSKQFISIYCKKIKDESTILVPTFGYSIEGDVVGKNSFFKNPNFKLKEINLEEQNKSINSALNAFLKDNKYCNEAIIHVFLTEDRKNIGILISEDEFQIVTQRECQLQD